MTATAPFDVAVTGVGAITPAGASATESWERICRGEATAATDPRFAGLPVDITCRIPGIDPAALIGPKASRSQPRVSQLALLAAREAVKDAGLLPGCWDGARVGVVIGTGFGGIDVFEEQHSRLADLGPKSLHPLVIPMALPNMVAGHVAMDLGATGPNLMTGTACASGATAIGMAREMLRTNMCDIMLAGGAESALTPMILAGFARIGALSQRVHQPSVAGRPFDRSRDGFVAAEGAAVLVMERMEDARARRAFVRARISGYGSSSDAHHVAAPHPQGVRVEQATRAALADAALGTDDIDHVNAHGTSTVLNDLIEGRMIGRVFGGGTAVTSVKGVTGHTLGAAGAVEAVCSVLTVQHGLIPPTAGLTDQDPDIALDVVTGAARPHPVRTVVSNTSGFGGHNAVLVVTAA